MSFNDIKDSKQLQKFIDCMNEMERKLREENEQAYKELEDYTKRVGERIAVYVTKPHSDGITTNWNEYIRKKLNH